MNQSSSWHESTSSSISVWLANHPWELAIIVVLVTAIIFIIAICWGIGVLSSQLNAIAYLLEEHKTKVNEKMISAELVYQQQVIEYTHGALNRELGKWRESVGIGDSSRRLRDRGSKSSKRQDAGNESIYVLDEMNEDPDYDTTTSSSTVSDTK
ncbi:hypothetical protein M3Y94_01103300 [Aphelenchoides besseyi]|nr:hypothetical protein M3Y94_01103300 [Aphelenchoides besseyi]KAI6221591.1 hypothetical protein M3Y95_00978400 [Aphelenchoides besseyi]